MRGYRGKEEEKERRGKDKLDPVKKAGPRSGNIKCCGTGCRKRKQPWEEDEKKKERLI